MALHCIVSYLVLLALQVSKHCLALTSIAALTALLFPGANAVCPGKKKQHSKYCKQHSIASIAKLAYLHSLAIASKHSIAACSLLLACIAALLALLAIAVMALHSCLLVSIALHSLALQPSSIALHKHSIA
jgi:hypothetical protein